MSFRNLKAGDHVVRLIGHTVRMRMVVREVREDVVVCDAIDPPFRGGWTFNRDFGCEEDHELEWGLQFGRTGSQLVMED